MWTIARSETFAPTTWPLTEPWSTDVFSVTNPGGKTMAFRTESRWIEWQSVCHRPEGDLGLGCERKSPGHDRNAGTARQFDAGRQGVPYALHHSTYVGCIDFKQKHRA